MSNNKDLTVIPEILEGVIVPKNDFEILTSDEKIAFAIDTCLYYSRLEMQAVLNKGYYAAIIQSKCEHGFVIDNYKKAGFSSERVAQQYTQVYKCFRELDSKKALKAFELLEYSKLRELTKLSKQNLNLLAKEPDIIATISQQTTQEFKQQLLPNIVRGDFANYDSVAHISKVDSDNEDLKQENEKLKKKLKSHEQLNSIDEIKIENQVSTNLVVSEIAELTKQLNKLANGSTNALLVYQDDIDRQATLSTLNHNAKIILVSAQRLHQFVAEQLSPRVYQDGELTPQEMEQIEILEQKRAAQIATFRTQNKVNQTLKI